MSDLLEFQDWGLIDYEQALEKQLDLVNQLEQAPKHPGYIILCSHPPVVTVGRQTKPEDIFAWSGKIIEISRGGRATYHGPSQLVIYPIFSLKTARAQRGPQEVRGYLRDLEKAIVLTLAEYNIEAVGKTSQKKNESDTETEETGVWIGSQKIASLGIAVKKWITYHGAAINLHDDPLAFQGLNPCGFKSSTMTSLEKLIKRPVTKSEFSQKLLKHLLQLL